MQLFVFILRGRKPGSGRKNGGAGAKGKDKKLSGTESEQEVWDDSLVEAWSCLQCDLWLSVWGERTHYCLLCDGNRTTLKTARRMETRRMALSRAQICKLHPGSTGLCPDPQDMNCDAQLVARRVSRYQAAESERGRFLVFDAIMPLFFNYSVSHYLVN